MRQPALFRLAEAEEDIFSGEGEDAVARFARARLADAAGIEEVNAAFGVVFLMHNMRVPEERDVRARAAGGGKQRARAALDTEAMPVAEKEVVPFDGKDGLSRIVAVEKGVAVAAHGDKRHVWRDAAQIVDVAHAVAEKEAGGAVGVRRDHGGGAADVSVDVRENEQLFHQSAPVLSRSVA